MTPLVAKLIWLIGVVGWFVIRYPHQRRARRTPKLRRSDRGRELVLMTISATGLGVIPMIYVFTGAPRFASPRLVRAACDRPVTSRRGAGRTSAPSRWAARLAG